MVARVSFTVECQGCGALNGSEFGNCMRCGRSLDDAPAGERVRRPFPAPRVQHRAAILGAGTEPLFGRFPAESLPATKAILTLTMLVASAQILTSFARGPSISALFLGGDAVDAIGQGALILVPSLVVEEPWRLISACFVHFGALHLLMNMMGLLHLCRLAEPAVGSVRLVIVYVSTGALGFAATVVYHSLAGKMGTTAGASGALFGVMGLVLGFLLRRKDERWKTWLMQTVAFSVVFGFIVPGVSVNNVAHLGGLATGLLFGLAFAPGAPKPSAIWQRVFATVLALSVLASLLLAHASPLPTMLRDAAL
ncbi:MAG: rhomboid family intramembrane serine protease [Myxococcales bacterium]|nr:rhomboid family intramembrane serine protease [Myxococcales bacterium]